MSDETTRKTLDLIKKLRGAKASGGDSQALLNQAADELERLSNEATQAAEAKKSPDPAQSQGKPPKQP